MTGAAESGRPPAATLLLPALRRVLRPLVWLALRGGVTFPVLADVLRDLFVDVATAMLTDATARTDSRLSLLTGIHRKEIRRRRENPPEPQQEPEAISVMSQILGRWLALTPWVDADGRPRPLPRDPAAGEAGGGSFDALVAGVTRDVRPRAVLEEWLRQGIVHLDATGSVVLDVRAFTPPPGGEEQMFYFARNLHDHAAAAAANVSASGAAPFLDRSLHYDRLSQAAAAELAAHGRAMAVEMLLAANRRAAALAEAEPEPQGPTRRVNLGVYLYVEDEPPSGGTA